MSNSLLPHELQHTRLPCPSVSPWVCSNSCPLSRWCHPTISSSVTPFSSCPQSFPASGSFPVSRLFASAGQRIRTSASVSVLPMNIQCWFPLGWTGLISLLFKGLSRVFSSTTVCKQQFFSTQPSLWSNWLLFQAFISVSKNHFWLKFRNWAKTHDVLLRQWTSASWLSRLYLFIKKSLLNLLQYCFCFGFLATRQACEILTPWPGMEPTLSALGDEVWTTGPPGKSPDLNLFWFYSLNNTFVRIPFILSSGILCSVSRFHSSVLRPPGCPQPCHGTVIITSTFPLTFNHCHLAREVG